MSSKIPAARLRKGETILVTGKISFSRLARLIEGEDLARRIAAETKRNSLYPTTVPHTTISIVDAVVDYADPANPTIEEQYVAEKFYTAKKGENAGKVSFGIDNKSANLPTVFQPNTDQSGTYSQLILENDLDSGLEVTLVLNTFESGSYANKGVGLQQVILREAPRYYNSAANSGLLAARGIIITGDVQRVSGADAAAAGYGDAGETAPDNTDAATGLPLPGVVAPAAQAAPATPVATVPVAQVPVVQAPVAQVPVAQAPVAPAAPVETVEQELARYRQAEAARAAAAANSGANSAFGAPAETAAPGSPWVAPTAQPAPSGIQYDE